MEYKYSIPVQNCFSVLTDFQDESFCNKINADLSDQNRLQAVCMAKSNDKKVRIFLDTGSSVNLLSKQKYDTMFYQLKLNSSNIPNLTGIVKGHSINAFVTLT